MGECAVQVLGGERPVSCREHKGLGVPGLPRGQGGQVPALGNVRTWLDTAEGLDMYMEQGSSGPSERTKVGGRKTTFRQSSSKGRGDPLEMAV